MTALDTPVQGRTSRAARRDAERAAGALVRRVRRTTRVALGVSGAGLVVGTAGLVLDVAPLLVGWVVALLAGYLPLALADAQRRRPAPRQGTSLHVLFERDVHEHLAGLAEQIGVRCPTEVWMVVEPEVRFEPDPDDPVLYIGSSLLWHLDVGELDRLVAGPLSAMRAVHDPQVRPGLLLAARLDCERLTSDTTPVVGALVRRLGRRLEAGRESLLDAVQDWGQGNLPARLRPTAADEAELLALREVGELEAGRRRIGAEVGVGLEAPTAGAMTTLAACDRAGELEPRAHRVVLRQGASLLLDQEATDRRLAERLASGIGDQTPLVPRAELPTQVWMAWWRRERDAGLPVVLHLTRRWPRSLAELLEVLVASSTERPSDTEPWDRVPLLGALLTRRPDRLLAGPATDHDPAGDQRRADAVVELASAAVRVVVVEQGRARLGWDDVWGARLLDPDGEAVPVDLLVREAVATRDTRELTTWLRELEVDLDAPWDDAEPPAGGLDELPIAAFTARFGSGSRRRSAGRSADVVVLDGWLLGYPHPDRGPVGELLGRLRSGAAGTRELLSLARTNRYDLVDVADPAMSVRLVDVTSAHLDGRSDGSGWWLRVETPGRALELTGKGSGSVVADSLHGDLGGRLVRSGTARPDQPATSWTARLCRLAAAAVAWVSLLGAAAVLVGLTPAAPLPGVDAWERALAVLVGGGALVLLFRVAQGESDRSLRRGGDPPRLPAIRRRADADPD